MDVILNNTGWMSWNLFLAFLSVIFGRLMLKSKYFPTRIFFVFLWLLFIPNTIYVLTDIYHLFEPWSFVTGKALVIVVLQYVILEIVGIITFVYSLHLFELLMKRQKLLRKYTHTVLLTINFIIAFGVVIGRIHRTNSWQVFTDPARVIQDCILTIKSPELLFLVIVFGIVGNITFTLLRKPTILIIKKMKKYSISPILKPLRFLLAEQR